MSTALDHLIQRKDISTEVTILVVQTLLITTVVGDGHQVDLKSIYIKKCVI